MDAHEVLCRARNGIERDGFDVNHYGEKTCGSARCACGWVAWEAGCFDPDSTNPAEFYQPEGVYADAFKALLVVQGAYGGQRRQDLFNAVEAEAFRLDNHRNGLARIKAWFDRAIAATAPPPPDVPLSMPEEVSV